MSELVFGLTWEEIDRAQRGGGINRPVVKYYPNPTATQADIDMLTRHGKAGLEAMQYFGVLDRLNTSGMI